MVRTTKYCVVDAVLLTGTRVRGRMHVQASTSSAIRPSDALRDAPGNYLILTNALVFDGTETREHGCVMLRTSAIAHVELPDRGWETE